MATFRKKTDVRRITYLGLLFALAVVLSYLESLVQLPGLPPGVKLGLSNIVTMYCLFFMGAQNAFVLAVLKAFSVFITRGVTAAALSLAGGLLSLLVMLLLLRLKRLDLSYTAVSIGGAVFHNAGQLLVACLITATPVTFFYFPVLLFSGVCMGVVTGVLLRTVLPAMERVLPRKREN
ncbi:MAG: Gx transporter family protein [Oscillospiraceae bacterium]|nr:Gx transporter family protein [Oscillospiraceae bacterium]